LNLFFTFYINLKKSFKNTCYELSYIAYKISNNFANRFNNIGDCSKNKLDTFKYGGAYAYDYIFDHGE